MTSQKSEALTKPRTRYKEHFQASYISLTESRLSSVKIKKI